MDLVMLGVLMVVVGLLLVVIEFFTPGFFIGPVGAWLAVIGALLAVNPDFTLQYFYIIGPVTGFISLSVVLYVYLTIGRPEKPVLSQYEVVGKIGVVIKDIDPNTLDGKVLVNKEEWSATAEKPIPAGRKVRVLRVEGVHLEVEEVEE